MNRRGFLGVFLALPLVKASPPPKKSVTYRITWGPLYPEFRTSPFDHEDRWGIYVRESGRILLIRRDQVVQYHYGN